MSHRLPHLLLSLSLLWLTACQPEGDPPVADLLPVLVQPLQASDHYPSAQKFNGRVVAPQYSELGFELPGRIAELYKSRGEAVAAGEVLARLDTRLLLAERDELLAQQRQIAAQLTLAERTQQRLEALRAAKFSSLQSLDEQASQVRALQANAQQVQAALAANQVKQDKSVLRVPFAGRIVSRSQALGAVVAAGQTLFSLTRTDGWEADIGVPSALVEQLQIGQRYTLYRGAQPIGATLLTIGAQVDGQTHTQSARFALDAASLAAGQLLELPLPERTASASYVLPLSALVHGLRGTWQVYVLDEQAPPRIVSRDVTLLAQDDAQVWVRGALHGAERVVQSGVHKVVPGQAVQARSAITSTAGNGQ
ncbi:MAG: efflux RND transporter periplasmic adaptor subunit [Aeromonas sp.]